MPDNSKTLTISDFRPGIVTNTSLDANSGYLDLPPGAAGRGTTGCYAVPTGALAPLPHRNASFDQSFSMSHIDAATIVRPVGLFTVGPLAKYVAGAFTQNVFFADELHLMCEGKAPAVTNHNLEWHVRKLYVPVIPADNVGYLTGGDVLGKPDVRGITGITARVINAAFGNPGIPTFVWEWAESPYFYHGSNNYLVYYPDPAATNSDTAKVVTTGPQELTQLSGRILLLRVNIYEHGANSGYYITNEDILYTDPPNSAIITGNQPTVLDSDNPAGFGTWGSLVYGELFLGRRSGGAITIDGDIYAPQVTILKGVRSVGDLMNVATATPAGLIYCVDDDGAYLWQGGNTSQKISTIPDRFYDRVNGNPTTGIKVKHTYWSHFVAFPNGWLYDTVTSAWWNLDATADIALVESGKGSPSLLFTAPDQFTTPAAVTVRVYDTRLGTDSYVWGSQPIRVSETTNIDITGIAISAANVPAGGATITITAQDANGAPQTAATFTFTAAPGVQPRRFLVTTGLTNLPNLIFTMTVQSTVAAQPAPTVLAISFNWIPSTAFSQTQ